MNLNKKEKSCNKAFAKGHIPYIGYLCPKTCTQKVNQVHNKGEGIECVIKIKFITCI